MCYDVAYACPVCSLSRSVCARIVICVTVRYLMSYYCCEVLRAACSMFVMCDICVFVCHVDALDCDMCALCMVVLFGVVVVPDLCVVVLIVIPVCRWCALLLVVSTIVLRCDLRALGVLCMLIIAGCCPLLFGCYL